MAVGETGLDFYRNLAPRQHQLEAFRDQLRLAEALHKPIVVHCRDAFDAIYEVLVSESPVGAGRAPLLDGGSALDAALSRASLDGVLLRRPGGLRDG